MRGGVAICRGRARGWPRLFLFAGWLLSSIAPEAAAQAVPDRIVLLDVGVHDDAAVTMAELQLYVEAALSPFPVRIECSPAPTQTGDAEEIAAQSDVLAVVWSAGNQTEMNYLVPTLGTGVVTRPVSASSTTARFEAMAAILLSELMPVLVDVFGEPPSLAPPVVAEVAEPGIDEEPGIAEEPPVAVETVAEEEASPPRPRVRLLLSTAYLAVPLVPAHGYLSGLGLGVGVAIGPHLHVIAGFDLIQPAEIVVPDSPARFQRWPIRVGAALSLPAGPLDLGPSLSALAEIWRVGQLDYEPVDPGALAAKRNLGMAVAFRAQIHISPWLAIIAEAGTDLFFAVDQVVYEDQVLLQRGKVQPRFAIGVVARVGR